MDIKFLFLFIYIYIYVYINKNFGSSYQAFETTKNKDKLG